MVPKAFPLPGTDGPGLDKGKRLLPVCPETGEPGPEEAIGWMETWSVDRLLIDSHLMLERQDLQMQGLA
jgi:hypothetical protein